jgi:hypothetical protein
LAKSSVNWRRLLYYRSRSKVVHKCIILDLCFTKCLTVYQQYATFIEQKGECIIRYFGRPCDEFPERVWPIKISDGARVTLFNKGLVSCHVNQSFLILLFEWEYVSLMMISCIFCYRRYCMMWRHLAPPPLWVSWYIVRLLTIERTRKHDTNWDYAVFLTIIMTPIGNTSMLISNFQN